VDHITKVSAFLEVAKHQSFAGAARALGISGPAVSKQVQNLEDQLGVKLLYRTTRKVSLTDEGNIYYQRARKALEDLDEAEQQIQELKACPTGRLKLNAPMSFGNQYLAKPIAEFARAYPEVEMEVDFDDRWVDVVGEGFDVVIRIGVLEDSSLRARKLATCPIVLCAAPSLIEQHQQQHGDIESPSDISAMPGIVYSKHEQIEEWHYGDANGQAGSVRINKAFSGNSAELQVQACQAGLGVALLPIFAIAESLASGDLVQLLPNYQTHPERGIYAVYPENRHVSTRVRLFIDHLVNCAQHFPW